MLNTFLHLRVSQGYISLWGVATMEVMIVLGKTSSLPYGIEHTVSAYSTTRVIGVLVWFCLCYGCSRGCRSIWCYPRWLYCCSLAASSNIPGFRSRYISCSDRRYGSNGGCFGRGCSRGFFRGCRSSTRLWLVLDIGRSLVETKAIGGLHLCQRLVDGSGFLIDCSNQLLGVTGDIQATIGSSFFFGGKGSTNFPSLVCLAYTNRHIGLA